MSDRNVLAATRRSLHAVAEAVVAGPQYRATGTMRLRQSLGGFGTTRGYGDVALMAVDGTDLVVTGVGGETVRRPLRGQLGELAAAAGVPFGGLESAYDGGAGATPEQRIDVDPAAAAELARAWAVGDAALRGLAGEAATPVLWPEHFDIAITLDEATFGVSPGDAAIPEPYAYVGPHRPRPGPFWNRPFGAARTLRELPDGPAVAAFFAEGRRLTRPH
jgi:hypothetical protein